jgi:Holliday junction resolvase RusA-like endonuclease
MTQIIINGRVASLKNSKQVFFRNGKIIFTSSEAWKKFEALSLHQLRGYSGEKFKRNVDIDYIFEMKGNGIDIDNAITGINDLLQKAGIIDDDKNIINITARKKMGCKEYVTKITIW